MIYVISDGEHYKIGYTAGKPRERLKTLQTGNPDPLVLLGARDGGAELERAFHRRFHANRYRGEWFRMSPGIAVEVALCHPGFAALAPHDPRLLGVAERAGAVEYTDPFCAAAVWYGWGDFDGIKDQMSLLVGSLRKEGPELLQTGEAYSAAYDALSGILPACRNCNCLDPDDLPG